MADSRSPHENIALNAHVWKQPKSQMLIVVAVHIKYEFFFVMDRSYQAENARSRPLPEAKLPWASPVVGWVTTCEPDVTICTFIALPFCSILPMCSSVPPSHFASMVKCTFEKGKVWR